jgi:hypothetical protein
MVQEKDDAILSTQTRKLLLVNAIGQLCGQLEKKKSQPVLNGGVFEMPPMPTKSEKTVPGTAETEDAHGTKPKLQPSQKSRENPQEESFRKALKPQKCSTPCDESGYIMRSCHLLGKTRDCACGRTLVDLHVNPGTKPGVIRRENGKFVAKLISKCPLLAHLNSS